MNRPSATAAREAVVSHEPVPKRPKLAVLGSSGLAYLRGLLCAASIRLGFDVDFFPEPCASYEYLLASPSSELSRFQPNIVVMTLDATYLRSAAGYTPPSAFTRWVKQQLGAVLIRHTVLPVLLPIAKCGARRSMLQTAGLLDAIEQQLASMPDQERSQIACITWPHRPEIYLQWSVPPVWRQPARRPSDAMMKSFPIGKPFSALFGLSYNCLVVDVNKHPWLRDRDVTAFLSRWSHTLELKEGSEAEKNFPDAFVFVDYDPFGFAEPGKESRSLPKLL